MCRWFSGSFAGKIRTLVLWCPFNSSSSDRCTKFHFLLLLLPLSLPLLLAILVKKVESNVTTASDETLRLGVYESRARSLAT